MRKTKIVCTIGPASASDRVLTGLIESGMNVARLNFSHGDYPFHKATIENIRRIARRLDKPVAILQDLPGPKIRIGPVAEDRVRLQARRPFVLTTRKILGSELAVSVDFKGLTRAVKKGDPILLGDGEIELEAIQVSRHEVKCRITVRQKFFLMATHNSCPCSGGNAVPAVKIHLVKPWALAGPARDRFLPTEAPERPATRSP